MQSASIEYELEVEAESGVTGFLSGDSRMDFLRVITKAFKEKRFLSAGSGKKMIRSHNFKS